VTYKKAKAVTWSAGFTVGIPAAGESFSGTAQTGYSQTASLTYVWGTAGQACGTNAGPQQAAQVVQRG
jgi:hypothetical protein